MVGSHNVILPYCLQTKAVGKTKLMVNSFTLYLKTYSAYNYCSTNYQYTWQYTSISTYLVSTGKSFQAQEIMAVVLHFIIN